MKRQQRVRRDPARVEKLLRCHADVIRIDEMFREMDVTFIG